MKKIKIFALLIINIFNLKNIFSINYYKQIIFYNTIYEIFKKENKPILNKINYIEAELNERYFQLYKIAGNKKFEYVRKYINYKQTHLLFKNNFNLEINLYLIKKITKYKKFLYPEKYI